MYSLVFVLVSSVVNLLIGGGVFFTVAYLATSILTKLSGSAGAGFAALGLVLVAFAIGLLAAILSLLPSYKLSLKFVKWLGEKKGIKIENPKKLFLTALGILLLPIILLILWGAIASAHHHRPNKPEKPPKVIHRRCKPFKYKQDKKAKKPKKAKKHPHQKDLCSALGNLDQLVGEESEEVAAVLPELLSSELTQNFSPEELETAIEEASETFGQIESIESSGELTIQGDWAEAEIEMTTAQGQSSKFFVIFHHEDGAWKIFGTEEL